ncbi:glycosyltransferase family 2 protein [Pedobacter mucosus]|uniref:glycosyltransferase family 2 protein n=1 Tax=Pedobacter mucosus TaxID=2895286 RepID=UPI001EE44755|nr:glycosyltransferase family 2 protein [Pedobacter mucosus]UKT63235.1 glycosyltransferase family 2 protein [Pedobacter mucosus]
MKVIAVVLTYNRSSLLKKCIDSINKQTYQPDLTIVIDNASTDETKDWLQNQPILSYHLDQNVGASGGFSECLKRGYEQGADWIWLMDDDTIPKPNALEQLMLQLLEISPFQEEVGFLSSSVLWTDGNLHAMNLTYHLEDRKKLEKLSFASHIDFPVIQFSTFVSILISAKAIEKVGLPLKEYFIWNDDIEYTKRIISNGLAGIAVKDSIAIHETPFNHFASVFTDMEVPSWKYAYGLRNELFTKRLQEGELIFWMTWIHRMFILPFRIILNRTNHRWLYTKLVWVSSLKALFFNPKIEMLLPKNANEKFFNQNLHQLN